MIFKEKFIELIEEAIQKSNEFRSDVRNTGKPTRCGVVRATDHVYWSLSLLGNWVSLKTQVLEAGRHCFLTDDQFLSAFCIRSV